MVLRKSQLEIGQQHEQMVVENLSRTQIVQYAGASGDFNPLHTDEIYASNVAGFPTTIAHGMLTMGMTARMLTDFVGDGQLITFGGRFGTVVVPGDSLIAIATVTEISEFQGELSVELSVSTTKLEGEEVFRGYAVARIAP